MCFSASKTTQWNVPDNGETVADLLRSRLHKLTAAVEIPPELPAAQGQEAKLRKLQAGISRFAADPRQGL
ncbi:MAG TPA: hypothetical protein DE060_05690 [Lentisphaeria bacterium]|nr:hypothetical protein [Lentisphaeria bacterium]HCG48688.1 hypothetical protein [Lentisphaeria bacterium]